MAASNSEDDHVPDATVSPAWFAAPVCRNCDAALTTPFCGQCGQKAAKRFEWRDVKNEGWERLRLFELSAAKTIRSLLLCPGTVARDFALGRRAAHMHPLKLLVALVAILVVLLTWNQYFGHSGLAKNADVDKMAKRVLAYANWSFSIGIVAIFLASWTVFRRRLGYNPIEHAILSVYCQSLVLALVIVNLLPTMIWRSPEFVMWHRTAAQYYVPVVKLLIVGIAYKQFFLLNWRTDWLRLASACLVYAVLNWALLRLYAFGILWLVS